MKITVSNGMRLIRIRYGIPFSELPDLVPEDLDRYLLFLLAQGKERPSVKFPMSQARPNSEGLITLKRLDRMKRWGFAHSLNSIRRNLPAGCRSHSPSKRSSWDKNAFSSSTSSSEYLSFVKKEITRMFPSGWDRKYDSYVGRFLPNSSARACKGRADHLWKGSQETFRRLTTTEWEVPDITARYKEVLSAGKVRPLIIFDKWIDLLGPLHSTLDNYMSRACDWRLFGPPTSRRVSSVCQYQYQTSVDLVNATDNLSLDVTETMLNTMFFSSLIPRALRSLALNSLHPLVDGNRVTHGQMMGGYLSFPLLCLHSYIAARWATRGMNANIMVNGDDCMISSDEPVSSSMYPAGYIINEKKTIFAENVAELNSTAFLRQGGKWREVHHLRRGGALNDYAGILHMAKACARPEWTDAFIRSRIGNRWAFLPSQIGLSRTKLAYYRQMTMVETRCHTDLPVPDRIHLNPGVLRKPGKPAADEVVAMTDYWFANGRDGGKKSDVYNPSRGYIRRSYSFRRLRLRSKLSFVEWRRRSLKVGPEFYLVPADYCSEEEQFGLWLLDRWRSALC